MNYINYLILLLLFKYTYGLTFFDIFYPPDSHHITFYEGHFVPYDINNNTMNGTDNNNCLVAITQGNELLTFPFLNKYNITLNCNKADPHPFNIEAGLRKFIIKKSDFDVLRIIFYNNINKNFLLGKIFCASKLILDVENNKFRITPITNDVDRPSIPAFSLVAKYYSYQLKEIPELPKYLRDFDEKIIKSEDIINFVKEQEPEYIDNLNNKIIFKEFYNNEEKLTSYKNDLHKDKIFFVIFEYNDDINNNHYYIGVPLQKNCKCTIINNVIIDYECEKISYQYNVEKYLLNINGIEYLTKNLFGMKVLINDLLEKLRIDINNSISNEENYRNKSNEEVKLLR